MKKLILTVASIISIGTSAQIKAVTDEGKEVVLFDNKTWKFVNESDEKTLETITTNENIFLKDKTATFLFKSKKVDAGIYINPKIWKRTSLFNNPLIEYTFANAETENLIGAFTTENVEVSSFKILKDLQISVIQKRADFFKLKESEYRTVNGLKVLYLRYIANSKGLDFEYEGYYYLTDGGYCSVMCYTFQKNFEKVKPKMDSFLNGLVETKKAETVEVYETPPPPIQTKKKN